MGAALSIQYLAVEHGAQHCAVLVKPVPGHIPMVEAKTKAEQSSAADRAGKVPA
jgi:hypothetical protein